MAIYGDVASEPPSPPPSYVTTVLPPLTPTPLSPILLYLLSFASCSVSNQRRLGPANFHNSTQNLDPIDFDLDYAYQLTGQPVADDVLLEVLQRFVDGVADAIGPKVRD